MSHRGRSIVPEQFELGNGLRVLMVENHSTPAVSMNLAMFAGSRDDPDERAGLAMMVSRLLEEGTRSRSSLEIADAIESVGGAIDSDCSPDRISVFLGVLSRDIDLGLELVGDMVQNPCFPETSITNERDRTLAEIQSALDRPQVVAGLEFNELVYGKHPLHRPVHGYPDTIANIGREDMVSFHERCLIPSNSLVSVVGDFSVPRMRSRLESVFGSWEPRPTSLTDSRVRPEKEPGVKSKFVSIPSHQAHIYLGHLGIERTHPDFYALQVMDAILGGGAGLTSRIPRKLRDEQGLAYTTFASITGSAASDPGKFLAYIGTSPENIEAAIDGFIAEIDRVRSEMVSAEELADAKAYLTGSFVFAFETNAQVARFLINADLYGLGFDYMEQYPAYIEGVTAEAIREAAARHLSTEDYVLVVAGPEGSTSGRVSAVPD